MQKKMSIKEWCKEFAPDMGYKFSQRGRHYYLIKDGKATVFTNLTDVRNHILRDLQRHIGKHTVIVDKRGR